MTTQSQTPGGGPRPMMWVMRLVVPLMFGALGGVLILMGHAQYKSLLANRDSLLSALGTAAIVLGLMVAMLDWLMQMSAESDGDRVKEEAAREQFARTGQWPEDE